MPKGTPTRRPAETQTRVRRGYFECRFGQLHVHHAMPPGGGFEESTPLLCLHDFPGSGRVFTGFLALAGRDRSVYAPDLPGFGESDPPFPRPSITDYAHALGDLLDSMRIRHLDVLGLRNGSLVAAELATTRPAQIGRVVLVSVPPEADAERQTAARAVSWSRRPDDLYRSPDWLQWASDAAVQYPLKERLAELRQSVLVLRPRDDLWEATARVKDIVPSARTLDFETPGSELFLSAPQRMADAVGEFLRG